MTTQADALRMAEQLEEDANALEACELVHDAKYLNQAAAMLREHAEGVEVTEAMVDRARAAYKIRLNQHVAATFDGDALQDAMCAALTAALSGREEGKGG